MNQEKDSVRSRLARVRRPQVNITYDLEVQGAVQERSLPFVVGVLADFSGQGVGSTSLRSRRFHTVDVDNFAEILTRMRPSLEIAIDEGSMVELEFDSLNDFTPQALIARVPELARLWRGRADVLAQKDRSIRAIRQLLNKHGLDIPVVPQGDDPAAAAVMELDSRWSSRLTAIIHHPDFRALESSWRGLWYLVLQTETSEDLKIELLDISRTALFKDLVKVAAYDQSIIFKKVFEDRFGSFGGEPFGVLIGDYEFSHSPGDIEILRNLAQVAAAAHAPFVAAVSAQMFGLDDFTQVPRIRDPAKIFSTVEYTSWEAFRSSEDARWIALTVPHVLLRTPYHYQSEEPDPYVFVEDTEALLWGNGAFALGACMTCAFAEEHWVSNIQGYAGGRVANLPVAIVKMEDGEQEKTCVSVSIPDRLEAALADLGFVALCQQRNGDEAVFFSVPSCQKPNVYDSTEATGNARLLAQIPAVMVCARFAQYLMVINRDAVGSFHERSYYERLFNVWLGKYVSRKPVDSDEMRAKYPLRAGEVSVEEVPGKPGTYQAILYIRPQYGMEGLTVSFRLVVRLPILVS